MQGRPELGKGRLDSITPPADGVMLWWLDVPSITLCRALIAEGSPANLEKAEKQLHKHEEMNETHHNTCQLISIRALQAMVLAKQDKTEEAFTILERTLTLAQPGGFVFPFVELGSPMAEMLKHMRKQNIAEDFIGQILTVFESDAQRAVQEETGRHATASPALESGPLSLKLSKRERDVLACLAEGLTNREIASNLFVSHVTVKKHLYNIYKKLDVHTRAAALNRSRELGIIPPD
jgi:LuxR family maltose regulon positive regulatory protein